MGLGAIGERRLQLGILLEVDVLLQFSCFIKGTVPNGAMLDEGGPDFGVMFIVNVIEIDELLRDRS